jgi:hypothetical protein
MAKPRATGGRDDSPLPTSQPVRFDDLDPSAIATFSSDRDGILGAASSESLLPETEEAFYARDPFSADYVDVLHDRSEARGPRRVNEALRADLLERPWLMERPEEGGHRGAAAVWRSLRAQLHQTGLDLPDSSDAEELRLLQRELETHRMVIESVTKGLDGLLKRIAQRLEVLDREAPVEPPAVVAAVVPPVPPAEAPSEAPPAASVPAAGE